MKFTLVGLLLVASAIAVMGKPDGYTTKYDNIDVDRILKSNRLLTSYVNCLLDKGPCTADAATLKEILPEALETDCKKCSEKQKESAEKILRFIINQKQDVWTKLSEKYDPSNKFVTKYQDKVDEIKKSADGDKKEAPAQA